jgi:hypothetical protein
VSQYLIRDVIYTGPQDPEEVVFRVLLFKFFNRIETWELLCERLGEMPSWEGFCFAAYDRVLGDAMRRGERVYSAAYIVPNPAFGEARKYRLFPVVSGPRAESVLIPEPLWSIPIVK